LTTPRLAMPTGRAEEARTCYSHLFGLPEILKPLALVRGGCTWFESDRVKIQLGVEAELRPARKAHRGRRWRFSRLLNAKSSVLPSMKT
jgi:hypothetical protein